METLVPSSPFTAGALQRWNIETCYMKWRQNSDYSHLDPPTTKKKKEKETHIFFLFPGLVSARRPENTIYGTSLTTIAACML